ncbi:hypothetical protein LINPERPRIM_LOCUS8701 [Linum perenne]
MEPFVLCGSKHQEQASVHRQLSSDSRSDGFKLFRVEQMQFCSSQLDSQLCIR